MTEKSPHIPALEPAEKSNVRPVARHAALLVASLYLVASVAWIAFSDALLANIARAAGLSLERMSFFHTIKGFAFVGATSLLLFLLVRHYLHSLERAQAEMRRRLEGIAQQYQQLFQHSPCAMIIYELGTLRVVAANDVSLMLMGYSRDQVLSMSCFDFLAEQERPRAQAMAAKVETGPRASGIWQGRRGDGRVVFVEVTSHEVEFNGKLSGISLLIDVTERLEAERSLAQYQGELEQRVADRTTELSRTNAQLRSEVRERQRVESELRTATTTAQAASASKSTFLANTTHEIRTPLTSILGYADLLADPSLGEAQRGKYLSVLQQNAQHLLALIDDLLDLSRAEMGKARVVFDDQSPREIAQQAIELLRPRAQEKSLAFTLDFKGELSETVYTDGVRLRQVLLNLLSNAIKFTPRGRVSLTLSQSQGPPGEPHIPAVRFEVSDTGIGMAAEDLQRVFEPFYQVDQAATRRYGGSGLGLAISRQLALQMGGTLDVRSAPGQGTTFTLELPCSQTPRPESTGTDPAPPAKTIEGTILLAEDNANIRFLVNEFLHRAGARVITVPDGAEALERVKAALQVGVGGIDLVLLDLHMPVLDGIQAMRQMRAAGYAGPIVGLTADYAEKSAAEWLREGWDALAAKPIDHQAFIPLLARMLALRQKQDGPGIARTV